MGGTPADPAERGIFLHRRSDADLPGTTMLISEAYETRDYGDVTPLRGDYSSRRATHTMGVDIRIDELRALPAAASSGR